MPIPPPTGWVSRTSGCVRWCHFQALWHASGCVGWSANGIRRSRCQRLVTAEHRMFPRGESLALELIHWYMAQQRITVASPTEQWMSQLGLSTRRRNRHFLATLIRGLPQWKSCGCPPLWLQHCHSYPSSTLLPTISVPPLPLWPCSLLRSFVSSPPLASAWA